MYYYKKRGRRKQELAQNKIKQHISEMSCPSCGGTMKVIEPGKDRDTLVCTKCGDVHTFTLAPQMAKPPKSPFSTLTLRDKSDKKSNPSYVEPVEHQSDSLTIIREGMDKQRLLSFTYISSRGEKTARQVEPYKLTRDAKGDLVLFAYDVEANGIKVFKLGGIGNLNMQEYEYKPRWNVEDKLKKD